MVSYQRPVRLPKPTSTFHEDQFWTTKWIQKLNHASSEIPLRIWIIQYTRSMNACDRVICSLIERNASSSSDRIRKCTTRWGEIKDTVMYHAELACTIKAPVHFHLVQNTSDGLCTLKCPIDSSSSLDTQQDLLYLKQSLDSMVSHDKTRLIRSIKEVRSQISSMKLSLQSKSQRVAIILPMDGLILPPAPDDETIVHGHMGHDPSDLFIQALKSFEELPVIFVVILSTHEKHVIDVSRIFCFNIDTVTCLECTYTQSLTVITNIQTKQYCVSSPANCL